MNQLRKAYGFEGTPVRLVFRAHAQKKRGGVRAPPPRSKEIRSARGRGERERVRPEVQRIGQQVGRLEQVVEAEPGQAPAA